MKKKANQRAIGQSNAFNRRRRAVQILACLLAVHLATITFAATPPSTNLGLPGIFDIDQRQSDNSITQTISYLSGVETTDPDKWRQFQIYLNSPGVPQADVSNYLDKIKLATSLLKQGDIATARRIVIGLSQYSEIDKSLSEELGKKVDAYYEIQQLKSKIETSNAQLKVALQTPQKTPDQISDDIRHMAQEQEDQRNNRDNSQIPESAPISPDPTTGQSQTVALPLTGQVPAPEMTQDYLESVP
jgi:hypothetical protein